MPFSGNKDIGYEEIIPDIWRNLHWSFKRIAAGEMKKNNASKLRNPCTGVVEIKDKGCQPRKKQS